MTAKTYRGEVLRGVAMAQRYKFLLPKSSGTEARVQVQQDENAG